MKFDINNYKGEYAMHCKTEEEARDFCDYLHRVGKTWYLGDSYLKKHNYNHYKENTAYNFNEGLYGTVSWYKGGGYTILEWSDFMNKKFTKADLKTGDVVKLNNGTVAIVNGVLNMMIHPTNGWYDLCLFKDDLKHRTSDKYDIVAVRRPTEKCDCQFCAFDHNWGCLIYERKEPEEMTLEEVCRELGREIKIVK